MRTAGSAHLLGRELANIRHGRLGRPRSGTTAAGALAATAAGPRRLR